MTNEDMKRLHLTPILDYIAEDHGKEGSPSRIDFEAKVDTFILGERLKEEILKAEITQEQLSCVSNPIIP